MRMVSIITPVYNSSKYLSQTIESVISQTYQAWEMIIIDDCSTDNSYQIIEKYSKKDTRIKPLKLEQNSGPAVARNKGIELAEGKYIAFLDSDDNWFPQKLEIQVSFMHDNNLAVTCSSYRTIDESNKIINTRLIKESFSYGDMLKSNHIGNLTGIYDCKKLGKIYMDDISHEDYTLWLKVMKKAGSTKAITESLAEYRISSNSISANKLKVLKWQWNIYRNIVGLDIFRSSYYFIWYIYYALKKRR